MAVKTKIQSSVMSFLSSEKLVELKRGKARYLRIFRIEKPQVFYFHQVDDPYSHLAVQKLAQLQETYDISFVPFIVGSPMDVFKGDASKFTSWASADAASIAGFFGCEELHARTDFSEQKILVGNARLFEALAGNSVAEFATKAREIGDEFWSTNAFSSSDESLGTENLSAIARSRIERGLEKSNQLRHRLGHYLSGTFYFEGEWFWGLDRLHLLEKRLNDEGYGAGEIVCPLPKTTDFQMGSDTTRQEIVVEYFPSLRSPYTAIGHKRALALFERTGVTVKLRPVMPMMMRGVPAPLSKKLYIMSDCAREARYYGDKFGPFCDPFGEPIRQAFAVYHHAQAQGLGMEFVSVYLSAAFAEGLDITIQKGLAEVCRRVGFNLLDVDFNANWKAALDENLSVMAGGSLWGVPSFRVTGGNDASPFSCWGQDRIWRVAAEIQNRTGKGANDANI